MQCYLCNSIAFSERKGKVRDAPSMKVLECDSCGLVAIDSVSHISAGFYEDSGMHGEEPKSIETWLKETDWDDQRRYDMLKSQLANASLLDFGCGAGGFLQKAQSLASLVVGVEPELRVQEFWESKLKILPDLKAAAAENGGGYDLITAFHVVEHLLDPRAMLSEIGKLLAPNGRMVIEVPSASDALLTLYDCDAFQRFTYWSQHLYLFTSATLEKLINQAGLKVLAIQNYQRYTLANHLRWLSEGKPGGHQHWAFLDNPSLSEAYAKTLASVGKTDTLIAYVEREH